MKNIFTGKMMILFFPAILLSCEALPINYSRSQSWLIPSVAHNEDGDGKTPGKSWTTISLLSVQIDRRGGWDSVEREITRLAPLFFWNQGCRVITDDERPAYAADIQVREREYNLSWRTKRSLAVEVRIWAFEDAPRNRPVQDQKLPLAAGRVVAVGELSLSSSDTTGRMLSKAIGKAVKELSAHGRGR